jgi:hypothetical protein
MPGFSEKVKNTPGNAVTQPPERKKSFAFIKSLNQDTLFNSLFINEFYICICTNDAIS